MKKSNRLSALALLHRDGALSRVEITKRLGCDGTTVTHIIRDLQEEGLIRPSGTNKSPRGRPRQLLELAPDSRLAIGLSVDPRSVTGVSCDLTGAVKVREQVLYDDAISRKRFIKVLMDMTDRLLKNVDEAKLVGLGLGTTGLLSVPERIVRKAAYFPATENIDFTALFKERCGVVPTIMDKSCAKGVCAIWRDREIADLSKFILLDIGVGIGCVIGLKGELYAREGEPMGEFGHSVYDPNGELCMCGNRGCLETLASTVAIERQARLGFGDESIDFEFIVNQYKQRDERVVEIVDKAADWMGIAVANLINFLTPDRLILSGTLLELGENYVNRLFENVERLTFPIFRRNVHVEVAQVDEVDAAVGAAVSVFRPLFSGVEEL